MIRWQAMHYSISSTYNKDRWSVASPASPVRQSIQWCQSSSSQTSWRTSHRVTSNNGESSASHKRFTRFVRRNIICWNDSPGEGSALCSVSFASYLIPASSIRHTCKFITAKASHLITTHGRWSGEGKDWPSAPMNAVVMKCKVANALQPFRRLCGRQVWPWGLYHGMKVILYVLYLLSWKSRVTSAIAVFGTRARRQDRKLWERAFMFYQFDDNGNSLIPGRCKIQEAELSA